MDSIFNQQQQNTPTEAPPLYPSHTPTQRDIVGSTLRRYTQGFLYGKDLWEDKDDSWLGTIGNLVEGAGQLSRFALLTILASVGVNKALTSIYKPWRSFSVKRPALSLATEDALTGLAVSGVDQLAAPKEAKPGLKGTAFNVAMFGAGGLGRGLAGSMIAKYLPKASELTKRVLTTTSDIVASTVGGIPFVEDKDQFIKEAGYELVAFATLDMLMYGMRMRTFELSESGKKKLQKAQIELDQALETGSEVNKQAVLDNISEVIDEIGFEKLDATLKDYEENGIKEIIKKVEEPSPPQPKQPEEVTTKQPLEQPDIKTIEQPSEMTVQELAQYIQDTTGNLSAQRLDELATIIKPSHGDAMNTTRFNVDGQAQELTLQIAERLKNRNVESLETTKAKAEQLTAQDLQEVDSLTKLYNLGREKAAKVQEFFKEAPEVLNQLRTIQAALAVDVRELAKKVLSSDASNIDRAKLIIANQRLNDITASLLDSITGAARTLSSMRIAVDGKVINFMDASSRILDNNPDALARMDAIIQEFGGEKASVKLAEQILAQTDINGLLTVAKKTKVRNHPFATSILNYLQASGLSSPDTQLRNIIGQTANALLDDVTDLVGSLTVGPFEWLATGEWMSPREALVRIQGDLYGTFYKSFLNPIIPIGGPNGLSFVQGKSKIALLFQALLPSNLEKLADSTSFSTTKSQAENLGQALTVRSFKGTKTHQFLNGISQRVAGKPLEEVPLAKLVGAALDEVGSTIKLPFTIMNLGDRIFASGGYFAEAWGEAYRVATGKRLKGSERKEYMKKLLEGVENYRREQKLLTEFDLDEAAQEVITSWRQKYTPEDLEIIKQIDEKAVWYANERTYKNPSEGLVKDIENFLNNTRILGFPVARLPVLYVRTPLQILSKVSRMNPTALAYSRRIREDIAAGGVRRQRAISGMIMGSTLIGLGFILAREKLITPSASTPSERNVMLNAGVQEQSAFINGRFIEINRLQPVSNFFTFAADYYKAIEDATSMEEAEEIFANLFTLATSVYMDPAMHLGAVTKTIWKQVKEEAMLSGLDRFSDAMTYGNVQDYFQDVLETAKYPSSMRRYLEGKETILGFDNPLYEKFYKESKVSDPKNKKKFPKRDPFGKPIEIADRLFGLRTSTPTDSKIRQEALRLKVNLTPPDKNIYYYNIKIELTDEQVDRMRKSLDEVFHVEDMLNKFVTSSSYKALPDKEQANQIKRYYDYFKKQAEYYIIATTPELQKQLPKAYVEQSKEALKKTNNELPWFK